MLENQDLTRRKPAAKEAGSADSGAGSLAPPMTHHYGSAAEYAEAVRAWLWAFHNWQLSSCLVPVAMHHQMAMAAQPVFTTSQAPPVGVMPLTSIPPAATIISSPATGRQYTIPNLGRRILSELVDCLLCFMLSLIFTLLLVEIEIIDLEKYEKLLNNEADLKVFIDITQDLFPMELSKRFFTSILEAIYLSRGIGAIPPGQTPGKLLIGLKVVRCEAIGHLSIRDSTVTVVAQTENVSFFNALIRSMLKNYALGFFFPLSAVMFLFNHNRSIYDVAAGTVVVEVV